MVAMHNLIKQYRFGINEFNELKSILFELNSWFLNLNSLKFFKCWGSDIQEAPPSLSSVRRLHASIQIWRLQLSTYLGIVQVSLYTVGVSIKLLQLRPVTRSVAPTRQFSEPKDLWKLWSALKGSKSWLRFLSQVSLVEKSWWESSG